MDILEEDPMDVLEGIEEHIVDNHMDDVDRHEDEELPKEEEPY